MKTFKTEKTKYFETKEQYQDFRKHWKECCNSGVPLRSIDYFLYAALCGKDIGKQFSPITSRNIPSKGLTPYYAMEEIYDRLHFAFIRTDSNNKWSDRRRGAITKIFGEHVNEKVLENLVNDIPHPRDWAEK